MTQVLSCLLRVELAGKAWSVHTLHSAHYLRHFSGIYETESAYHIFKLTLEISCDFHIQTCPWHSILLFTHYVVQRFDNRFASF